MCLAKCLPPLIGRKPMIFFLLVHETLVFHTTFLIDFQRELSGSRGGVHVFLGDHAEAVAYLPMTTYGEFAAGFPNRTDVTFFGGGII